MFQPFPSPFGVSIHEHSRCAFQGPALCQAERCQDGKERGFDSGQEGGRRTDKHEERREVPGPLGAGLSTEAAMPLRLPGRDPFAFILLWAPHQNPVTVAARTLLRESLRCLGTFPGPEARRGCVSSLARTQRPRAEPRSSMDRGDSL